MVELSGNGSLVYVYLQVLFLVVAISGFTMKIIKPEFTHLFGLSMTEMVHAYVYETKYVKKTNVLGPFHDLERKEILARTKLFSFPVDVSNY